MSEPEHFSADQLARWGLLELARREACRDALILGVEEPPEAVLAVLRQQQQTTASRPAGPGLASDAQLARQWRWQQWCRQTYEASVASTYLQRKAQLDQVVFWQLCVGAVDLGPKQAARPGQELEVAEELAAELFLRLREGETTFAALAGQSELRVQRHGPLRLEQLPVPLAQRLRAATPGVVQAPWRWGEDWLVLQLEQLFHASLDSALQQQLLAEIGEARLQQELQRLSGAASAAGD